MIPYDPVVVEAAVGLVRTVFVARMILRPLQTYFLGEKRTRMDDTIRASKKKCTNYTIEWAPILCTHRGLKGKAVPRRAGGFCPHSFWRSLPTT